MPLDVVMVDDEKDLGELFFEIFSDSEVRIRHFSDPETARVALVANPPDLLVVDYRMPGVTGDAFVSALKPEYPVILMSGDLELATTYPFWKKLSKQPYPEAEIRAALDELRKKAGP